MQVYARAFAELGKKIGTNSQREYDTPHDAAERARLDSEEGRQNLNGHISEHGC